MGKYHAMQPENTDWCDANLRQPCVNEAAATKNRKKAKHRNDHGKKKRRAQ